ncbi:unnamed protein product [Adineta steineri]|uniref:F-box domain-containing protein n=1 Tax=Adineta steineri TaxID=433720 RepID=A0A813ZD99_9BILA|nr:unnamed protein product [Adineta steineri]CAF1009861.1 unnamed protein product [Adineta steineri]CAF1471930.1 unnamed protein product [Adineta steineri]CAF1636076.1 unnamed protein product [Adineta steineri]
MNTGEEITNYLTILETFPNELFMEICSYLTSIDIIIAFSNLNHRFQSLISQCCEIFDLNSVNKSKCDFIFQIHNTHQWKSLRISNSDEKPYWMNHIIENYIFTNNFSQLQFLTVGELKDKTQTLFFSILTSLTNLIYLSIESLCAKEIQSFDLPKLKKLVFSSCLSIDWIQNFSQIETIEYTINHFCENKDHLFWPLTIKHLKFVLMTPVEHSLIYDSLISLSQLTNLEIYQLQSGQVPMFGNRWEQLIHSSCPLLRIFRFYFLFRPLSLRDLKQLMNSYATPFFLKEKKWFVNCHLCASDRGRLYSKQTMFYTLPYPMKTLTTYKNSLKKTMSTLPIDDHVNIYRNVETLIYGNYLPINNDFNRTKINNLVIDTQFEAIHWLHTLTNLQQLHIDSYGYISIEQFRLLLDNASRLYSLSLRKSQLIKLTDDWNDFHICKHLSQKIRVLKFQSYGNTSECFNEYEIERMVSIFGNKCECLSLGVQIKTHTIEHILSRMLKLSYLFVFIPGNFQSSIKKQLPRSRPLTMEWLEKQQTPFNRSNCIFYGDLYGNHFLL